MSDEPQNIREFEEMVGTILGRLYAEHPSELPSDADAFLHEGDISDDVVDLFDNTVNYLVRAGYLHSDKQFYLQLTPQSWDVMQKPNPLQPEEAVGATLAKWAAGTASEVGKSAITQASGAALSMLYSVVKSGIGG